MMNPKPTVVNIDSVNIRTNIDPVARMLESEEAARRLGIKMSTLYAYVSRGLLPSYPSGESRRSLFDLEDVERLARRSRSGKRVETRIASITTGVTQLRDDGPSYRGTPASDLASTHSFESVADMLWQAEPHPQQWQSAELPRPPKLSHSDLLEWAVLMCGALDPLRSDLRPETIVRNARKVIATSVAVLGGTDQPELAGRIEHCGHTALFGQTGSPIASRLAGCLAGSDDPSLVRAFDTALVVLADHELATSTMAVRVAASTRADIYNALTAGLSTLAGPLHGGASELAHGLLVQAENIGVGPALDATLRWQGTLPGFGHTVYKSGDPRFSVLLSRVEDLATTDQCRLVHSLMDLASAHAIPGPNIDLALAFLSWVAGLQPDSGRTIFSVARLAGWTAHYLEELGERPLRFRARAVYSSVR
jgi:citrate synthase